MVVARMKGTAEAHLESKVAEVSTPMIGKQRHAAAPNEVCSCFLAKPLLQYRWHAHFDEASFACWNEQGAVVKMKKLKHLITSLLR